MFWFIGYPDLTFGLNCVNSCIELPFMECTPKVIAGYLVNRNVKRKPPTPDVWILHFILFNILNAFNTVEYYGMILMYILPCVFDNPNSTLYMSYLM